MPRQRPVIQKLKLHPFLPSVRENIKRRDEEIHDPRLPGQRPFRLLSELQSESRGLLVRNWLAIVEPVSKHWRQANHCPQSDREPVTPFVPRPRVTLGKIAII